MNCGIVVKQNLNCLHFYLQLGNKINGNEEHNSHAQYLSQLIKIHKSFKQKLTETFMLNFIY